MSAQMLVPLYGFLEGDVLGLLVLVQDHDTIDKVAAALVQAASIRVAPRSPVRVLWKGRPLENALTVAQVGLTALDRIDVVHGDAKERGR